MDLVSVIITTKDRWNKLTKAIDSVLNQTYENIEIIVVDDGSEDGTKELIKEYKNIKYIYIEKENSKGGNYARNQGIKMAKGNYVAFLDDDDEWLPNKIKKQVKKMKEKDYSFIGCGRINIYNEMKNIPQNINKLPSGNLKDIIFTFIPYNTSCILTSMENLKKVNYFDESLKAWQEYDLEIRLSELGDVGVVAENLVLYNINTNDSKRVTNSFSKFKESLKIIEEKYSHRIEKIPEQFQKKHNAMIYSELAKRAGRNGMKKEQKKYLKEMLKYEFTIKNLIKYSMNISRLKG